MHHRWTSRLVRSVSAAFFMLACTTEEDSGRAGATGATASSGPVQIKNLSATKEEEGASLRLTFALANGAVKDVELINEIVVRIGGDSVSFPIYCQDPGWLVGASASSGVLELTVEPPGEKPTIATFLYYKGASKECSASTSEGKLASMSGTVSLKMKGVLADATPWTTEAEASLP